MLARAHVGWGLAVSLLLHVTGIAALALVLPRLSVKPGVVRRMELAIVRGPPPIAAGSTSMSTTTASARAATVEVSVEPLSVAATEATAVDDADSTLTAPAPAAPKPVQPVARKPKPKPVATPATPEVKLQSATNPDNSSDGSALERVLRQIAATSELTQDERRRAMLVVLRTWEDPSGKHSADELIEALLKNVRQARTAQPPESPADSQNTLQP